MSNWDRLHPNLLERGDSTSGTASAVAEQSRGVTFVRRASDAFGSAPAVGKPIRRVGRYALYSAIASGGMARVHFGRLLGPSGFSRSIAIKRLHPHYAESKEIVAMLLDEAKLVSRIQHPNVVSTIDMVDADGEVFVVMEYVPGESLARLIRATRKAGATIPLPIVMSIANGLLQGLHAAHTAKSELDEDLDIVHRDVSPHNVLVGIDGLARVLDFGVAKARDRLQSTRAGQVKGKLAYLSPEQILCDEVSPRTDVYAAAVVVWEALTGQRLFEASNDGALVNRVLEADVPPPSALVPGIPRAVDALVLRGLDRRPEKRFASALEFAIALEEAAPAASSRRVSDWVKETAAHALAERAAQLIEIERASVLETAGSDASKSNMPVPIVDESTSFTATRPEPSPRAFREEAPIVNVESSPNAAENSVQTSVFQDLVDKNGGRRRGVVIGVLSLCLVLVLFASWKGTRSTMASGASMTATQSWAPPSPEVAAVPAPPMPSPTSDALTAPPTSVPSSESSTEPPTTRPPQARKTTRRAAPPAPPTTAQPRPRKNECDPPYVLDERGVRRWKRECR